MKPFLLVLGLVVVLGAGFVLLRPSDDDKSAENDPPATATTAERTRTATTPARPAPAPKPKVITIRVKGNQPVGGVRAIKVDKGGQLRFRVVADQPENAHLHGYDVAKPVGPGKVASFSMPAKLEGIFELELENSAVPIGEVTVTP